MEKPTSGAILVRLHFLHLHLLMCTILSMLFQTLSPEHLLFDHILALCKVLDELLFLYFLHLQKLLLSIDHVSLSKHLLCLVQLGLIPHILPR